MTPSPALESAVDFLREVYEVHKEGGGGVTYREYPGTGKWYRVSACDLNHLSALIAADGADIYSQWCAESDVEETPA
jgi:hypothetical protein